MSTSSGKYLCDYCSTRVPTQQGLRSHIAQSEVCSRKQNALYAEDSDSGVDSEPEAGAGSMDMAGDIFMDILDPRPGSKSDSNSDTNDLRADPPNDLSTPSPASAREATPLASGKRR